MIQRIQSVWLLLAALFAIATMKFPFFSGNITDATNHTQQFLAYTATVNIWILIVTVAISVASLVTIFLYKDRKRQLMVTSVITIVAVINVILYFSGISKYSEGNIALSSIWVFAIPLWLILAIRGIWKDEQLVRNTNRLR